MEEALFHQFNQGILIIANQEIDLSLCPWNKHKEFIGVYLKNLVTLEQTHGLLSCHLVRIEPNCEIRRHTHPSSLELHEVIKGSGTCQIEEKEIAYVPGVIAVIERDKPHNVIAGNEGLFLFAKFISDPT